LLESGFHGHDALSGKWDAHTLEIDAMLPVPYFSEMTSPQLTTVTCHCRAISITLAKRPAEVTDCNCSLCQKYGVLWAYYAADDRVISPNPPATDIYAWNGKHVDFHRCQNCGCVTHGMPRDLKRDRRGINARLLPPDVLAAAKLRHRDGAVTGKYLD
jgi:hypothetical protein